MARIPQHGARVSRRQQSSRLRVFIAFALASLLFIAPFSSGVSGQVDSPEDDYGVGRPAGAAAHKEAEFVPGEVLVRFRESSPLAKNQARLETMLRALDRDIPARVERFDGSDIVSGLRLAHVAPAETLATIAALNQRPDVLYAEPNYLLRPAQASVIPNDPRFPEMYGLRNTGQFVPGGAGTAGADIDADLAWGITTGSSNVVVGVIDTGIDINHTDLRDNIWVNPGEIAGNGIDDDGNGRIDDVNGWDFSAPSGGDASVFDSPTADDHGTHVAGTIGASGNNGVGVTGINWQVKIMSLKFIGASGSGATSNAVAAINYAIAMRNLWESTSGARGANIRVLNNSWGGAGQSNSLRDAISAANRFGGILFVAAAGNDGTDNDDFPHYPASYTLPNVISVARTNQFDNMSASSNFGARTVHLGAPGNAILSTVPNNGYAYFSGTSMAAPHVSGVAALILSQDPPLTLIGLRSVLQHSGNINVGSANVSVAGRTYSARRLNAYQSLLNAATNDSTYPRISNLFIAAQDGRSVTLQFQAGDDGLSGLPALYYLNFRGGNGGDGSLYRLGSFAPTGAPGAAHSVTVEIPPRYAYGTINLHVTDEVGNEVIESVVVQVNANAADPYAVALSDQSALSSGGTPLTLNGDDRYHRNYALNFNFPFFGKTMTQVTVSTNGALYFSLPPIRPAPTDSPQETADDPRGSIAGLNNQNMIAGMWDDIRTDRTDGDVYVVRPDANRVIFRWQGVTFTGEQPINFEIELRSDGTIIKRYGSGNTGLRPVVGISGGHGDTLSGGQSSYVVSSHTSVAPAISLTNAQTITYEPRGAGNPIDDMRFFVRQHYLDFLSREPDAAGWEHWANQTVVCHTVGDPQQRGFCIEDRRNNVSAAFFLSIEFQETGYFVYRFYRASFPESAARPRGFPRFTELMNDTRTIGQGVVVGTPGWDTLLENNKQSFARAWVQRAEFVARYPQTMAAAAYVNQLFQTAGVTPTAAEQQAALNAFNSSSDATEQRARALRSVAESQSLRAQEFNRAFVLMQYFGYLRRNPDDAPDTDFGGYDFWLGKLNDHQGNFISSQMVLSFLVSGEYRARFGQ